MRTLLNCGHSVSGIHHGPWAWCKECVDWVPVGANRRGGKGKPKDPAEQTVAAQGARLRRSEAARTTPPRSDPAAVATGIASARANLYRKGDRF